MKITISGFILPSKESGKYSMCEDSLAVNVDTQAIAIADGVGGSLFPEYLSRHLTTDFVSSPGTFFKKEGEDIVLSNREQYQLGFEEYADNRINSLSGIKQKILQTKREHRVNYASSTFVGCIFTEQEQSVLCNYWTLGDSYLFFVDSKGELLKLSSMSDQNFGGVPHQIKSNGVISGKLLHDSFDVKEGVMLLMTDALSDWFIKTIQEDNNVIGKIKDLHTHEDFKLLVDEELSNGSLKDDDMALILLEIENNTEPHLSIVPKHIDDLNFLIASENTVVKTEEDKCSNDDEDSIDGDKSVDGVIIDDATQEEDTNKQVQNRQEDLEKEIESKGNELASLESELQSVEVNYLRLKDLVKTKRAELEELKDSLKVSSSIKDTTTDSHKDSLIEPIYVDRNDKDSDDTCVVAQNGTQVSAITANLAIDIKEDNQ